MIVIFVYYSQRVIYLSSKKKGGLKLNGNLNVKLDNDIYSGHSNYLNIF